MKKTIALLSVLILIAACDNPRSQRTKYSSSQENSYSYSPDNNGNSSGSDFSFSDGSSDSGSNSGSTDTTNSIVPVDAKHCKFSSDGVNGFESSSTHIGAYTLCQSSTDKSVFYIQIKTPPVSSSGDTSVCFIPHTTSGSTSIYIGNPMCSTFPDPKSVKKITFVKYSQYTNALINSVMFFKDATYYYPAAGKNMNTLAAYSQCMAALSVGNSLYCQSFRNVGQYVLKNF